MKRHQGHCTATGSSAFHQRFNHHPDAVRAVGEVKLSTVGVGTYLGDSTDEYDQRYTQAITAALEQGCNVIDTAVNYRCQRSERNVGAALAGAIDGGTVQREEVFISTKGGFVPFDGARPDDMKTYFEKTFVEPGHASYEDVVAGCHVMTPDYLAFQLQTSLDNLGLETVDLYYVHNPEIQLTEVDNVEFTRRIRAVFEWLEEQVDAGTIGAYGTATWNGYRLREGEQEYLSLAALERAARDVGGNDHHFRYIQLPVNLGMLEAWRTQNHAIGSDKFSTLELAQDLGIHVMTSGSILQGRFAQGLPGDLGTKLGDLETNAQRAINFVRSIPGVDVALVGMSNPEHVAENVAVLGQPRLTPEALEGLFAR